MRYDNEANYLLNGNRIIRLTTKDGKREKVELEISKAFSLFKKHSY